MTACIAGNHTCSNEFDCLSQRIATGQFAKVPAKEATHLCRWCQPVLIYEASPHSYFIKAHFVGFSTRSCRICSRGWNCQTPTRGSFFYCLPFYIRRAYLPPHPWREAPPYKLEINADYSITFSVFLDPIAIVT